MIDTARKMSCKRCKEHKYILEFKVLSPGIISSYCKDCRAKMAELKWKRKQIREDKNINIY
jgi:late competence protein required for DNA uptake (superfamily II DNA/RNA helicase)